MPYPPRSKCLPVPVMSQANPKRGWNSFQEEAVRVRLPVLPTSCVMVCAPGSLVGKLGFIMTWRRSQIPLLLVVKVFPSCDCRQSALASQRRLEVAAHLGEIDPVGAKFEVLRAVRPGEVVAELVLADQCFLRNVDIEAHVRTVGKSNVRDRGRSTSLQWIGEGMKR